MSPGLHLHVQKGKLRPQKSQAQVLSTMAAAGFPARVGGYRNRTCGQTAGGTSPAINGLVRGLSRPSPPGARGAHHCARR